MSVVLNYTSGAGEIILADLAHLTRRMEEFILRDARLPDRPRLIRTFAKMSVRERRLLAAATGAQRAIGWRSWAWLRYEPAPGSALATACTIYGRIYGREELRRAEEAALTRLREQGIDGPPAAMTVAAVHESYGLGWRYGMWYSDIEPWGEPGENHIAQLTPMSRAQFEAARRAGWPEVPPVT